MRLAPISAYSRLGHVSHHNLQPPRSRSGAAMPEAVNHPPIDNKWRIGRRIGAGSFGALSSEGCCCTAFARPFLALPRHTRNPLLPTTFPIALSLSLSLSLFPPSPSLKLPFNLLLVHEHCPRVLDLMLLTPPLLGEIFHATGPDGEPAAVKFERKSVRCPQLRHE